MDLIFSSILGTFFYSVVIFIAGGFIGPKLWNWAKQYLPWER